MAKILVIEDSNLMKVYLRRCLENEGFEVEGWTPMSAMEVSDKLNECNPDLVLTDYQMAGCNGASVARMVQKSHPKVPVIALTADRSEEIITNLKRFSVKQILYKPVEPDALAAAVKAVLEELGS